MLVTNKTVFGRTKKFSEKNLKSLKNFRRKKSSVEQKDFSGEDIFCSQNIHEYSEKMKLSKRKFGNFICNEDHRMPILRITNVRVFPKTIVCDP